MKSASPVSSRREIYERRHLQAIAARWNAKAQDWDRELANPACHLNDDHAYERFFALGHAVIREHGNFCPGQGMIDLGCGTGLVLAEFISEFAWGIGIDVGDKMLGAARQKNIPGAKFVLGDAFQLAELCPPAGAVLSRGVLLSHYGQHQGIALLKAVRETLVRDGFALFDFLNAETKTKFLHRADNKVFFTTHQACALAAAAGFGKSRILGEPEKRRVLLLFAE